MKDLILRKVTEDDARILFEWRNDENTRQHSRTTEPIEWKGHVRWLKAALKRPSCTLVIAELEGKLVGTIRADDREDGFTEISYTIAPTQRGKGLSKPIVLAFVKEYMEGKKIAADIKKGHRPSESVAKALGLAPHHQTASGNPDDPRPMVEWR